MHKQTNSAHHVIKSHYGKHFFWTVKCKTKRLRTKLSPIRYFCEFTEIKHFGFSKQRTILFFRRSKKSERYIHNSRLGLKPNNKFTSGIPYI